MTVLLRRLWRATAVVALLLLGFLLCRLWIGPLLRWQPAKGTRQRPRIVRWWTRRLLEVLHVRLEVRGTPATVTSLYVANHISWLDIPCLMGMLDTVFVAKQDVAHWPLLGKLTACSGTLFLARGHGSEAASIEMTALLRRGQSVAIFPEGTSTDGGTVRPFHARLYQAAIASAVPVQAVAVHYGGHSPVPFVGDDRFAPHLWRLLGEPEIRALLHFCPAVDAPHATRRALAETTRAQICIALEHEREPATSSRPSFRKFARQPLYLNDSGMTAAEAGHETAAHGSRNAVAGAGRGDRRTLHGQGHGRDRCV